ncbi:MAG: hypothetical protein AAF558_03360 [Verrucomicrobiota bacterium]
MQSWEAELRARYPVPNTRSIGSYYFSLDGGGRKLVTDAILNQNIDLMIEIGGFLCGSTRQWLESNPKVKVICIDPWTANFAAILERYDGNPVFEPCFSKITDRAAFIASVKENGPFASAIANCRGFEDRFIPVKAKSPDVLTELHGIGVVPGLIYFDSDKLLDDLEVALELFPDAVLSGDDWTWGADQGFPVQKAVRSFCQKYGFKFESDRATWVINS